jgi:hypothetical protein
MVFSDSVDFETTHPSGQPIYPYSTPQGGIIQNLLYKAENLIPCLSGISIGEISGLASRWICFLPPPQVIAIKSNRYLELQLKYD